MKKETKLVRSEAEIKNMSERMKTRITWMNVSLLVKEDPDKIRIAVIKYESLMKQTRAVHKRSLDSFGELAN